MWLIHTEKQLIMLGIGVRKENFMGGDPVTRGFDSYTHIVSHKMGGEGEYVKCECY